MKKKILIILGVLFFLWPKAVEAQQVDGVTNFSAEITINQDTSVSIKETIDYQTNYPRHGIYRYIPYRYQREGFSYSTKITEIEVNGAQGSSIPFTKSWESGNLVLKIGDPERTFTGEKIYILSYRVEDALKRFENHDELYWDITGEGWQIPIEKSRALIVSPFAKITKIECYSGPVGGDDGLCEKELASEAKAEFYYPVRISYGDNMTVAVALDQEGAIVFPSLGERVLKWVRDNFFVFLVPLPFLVMFFVWYKRGRDWMFLSPNIFNLDESQPKRLKPIFYRHRMPLAYEPLENLTPGEAGAILDEKLDNQDVVAEILDLARKKYLRITALEKKGFLKKEGDYLFTRLKEPDSGLPEHQKYLLEEIFDSKEEKKLSKLEGKFYTKMEKTKEMMVESITAKKLFTANMRKTRAGAIGLGVLLNILALGLMIIGLMRTGSFWPILLFGGQVLSSFFLAYNMPQKTAVGTNLMLQARGLKETIKRGKWREEIKEKNLFIEEIFPFAVAFGVVEKLAKDMEELNLKPPSYLEGYSVSQMSFANFSRSFSTAAATGLGYHPSSSSWSGGSGFSGGGGSSGGGGGGGGGGSW